MYNSPKSWNLECTKLDHYAFGPYERLQWINECLCDHTSISAVVASLELWRVLKVSTEIKIYSSEEIACKDLWVTTDKFTFKETMTIVNNKDTIWLKYTTFKTFASIKKHIM